MTPAATAGSSGPPLPRSGMAARSYPGGVDVVAAWKSDTHPDLRRLVIDRWRAMTVTERAELVDHLSADTCELALIGIRARHPDATPEEQQMYLRVVLHGDAVVRESFGWPTAERGR